MNTHGTTERAHFLDPIRPRVSAGIAGRPVDRQFFSVSSVTPFLRVDPVASGPLRALHFAGGTIAATTDEYHSP